MKVDRLIRDGIAAEVLGRAGVQRHAGSLVDAAEWNDALLQSLQLHRWFAGRDTFAFGQTH